MNLVRVGALIVFIAHPALAQQRSVSLKDSVAAVLPSLIDSAGIPGLAIAYLEKGKVEWTKGFGTRSVDNHAAVDANTVFEAASLSKPVVAYATLKLVDAGMLDLDKPLKNYIAIPEIVDPRANRITTRMILSHTTGLQN